MVKGMKLRINLENAGLLFFDITFFLFAFMSMDSDSFATKLKIFYIPGYKNFYHFVLSIGFLIIFILLKRGIVKVDEITVLLGLKLIYDFINSFYIQNISLENWGRWFQTDVGFLSYFVVINTIVKPKDLIKRYELFTVVIAIQVFHVFLLNRNLSAYAFKNAMRIPFALSNVIAGVLVAGFVAVLLQEDIKKKNRVVLCAIYFGGALLTRSRSALFLLDLLLLWRIHKIESLNKKIKWFFIWSIFNCIAIVVISKSPIMQAFFSGIKGRRSLNDFSTNRIDLLKYGFEEFKKAPLLGRGVYYEKSSFIGSTGIHNIVLELLAESGIIGFAIYISALFLAIKKSNIKRISNIDRNQIVVFGILLSFFVNSLVEVVYFNYIYDVLFWSFTAVLVSNANQEFI